MDFKSQNSTLTASPSKIHYFILLSVLVLSFGSVFMSWKLNTEIANLEYGIRLLMKEGREVEEILFPETANGVGVGDDHRNKRRKRSNEDCICPIGKYILL